MVETKLDLMVLQDELPTILTASMNLKGHHVYKNIWTPKQVEYYLVDKYVVCV